MVELNGQLKVLIERHPDGVSLIALNRPSVHHAIDSELIEALAIQLDALAQDASLRVLVLTSTSTDAFCSGADLRERRQMTPEQRAAHTGSIEAVANGLAAFPAPTIAAVNGFALAGGAEIALACDIRVAASTVILGFPEVRIGIFPGAGGVLRLPTLIGSGAARDLLFTGRRVKADEAFRMGLIDHLVPGNDAIPAAREMASTIATNAPLAVRALKSALRASSSQADSRAAEIIARYRKRLDDTEDYAEGLAAFAEQRSPRFVGR
ncbi:MAG: enoyl-CoA hydratase/isomerase family protein [Thermomicrobiales bacterium]